MIEVLKTNVKDRNQAKRLIDQIHKTFLDYHANFDLEDCDRILRVKSTTASIQVNLLINLLKANGVESEILEDEVQPQLV